MDTQAKRTILATVLCLVILFGWMKLMKVYNPPPKQVTSAPAASQPAPGAQVATSRPGPASAPAAEALTTDTVTRPTAEMHGAGFVATNAPSAATVTLGNDRQDNPQTKFANPYDMGVVITPRGAGVESLKLSRHRDKPPADPKHPNDDPYPLLRPVENPQGGQPYDSFVTESIRLLDEKATVPLDDVIWSVRNESVAEGENVVLQTRIKGPQSPGGEVDVLEITKTYLLRRKTPCLLIGFEIRNLSDKPQNVLLTERGPVGIKAEDPQREYRRVTAAVINEETGQISSGTTVTRANLEKAEEGRLEFLPGEGRQRLWAAISNKYFGCIEDPWTSQKDAKYPDYIGQVYGRVLLPKQSKADDLTVEWVLKPRKPLEPRGQAGDTCAFEFNTYCGPKGMHAFDSLPPDLQARHYEIVSIPDVPWCTFSFLTSVMLWLLTHTYRLVGNYGVAIIVLVVIVRLVLHPISKRSQVNMMKMQKGMALLKPKIDAIQQQYKNDKTKLNEETMKLYREEGINPTSQFFGCLPMFLQMPIWVALYTTLNIDVDLRHQPFCLWMRDLSSQDALINLSGSYSIPLIGNMMGPITAFNLLPIIMTVTMYAQQKLTQKMSKPAKPPPPKTDKDGNPVPDQMAQQQKMMNYMTIFFGFLFYNFPSGLNLYILSSNLLGMLEQYIIKKEIRRKEAGGEFEVKKKPATDADRPSLFGRYLGLLQKKAEEARQTQSDRPRAVEKKRGKGRD